MYQRLMVNALFVEFFFFCFNNNKRFEKKYNLAGCRVLVFRFA